MPDISGFIVQHWFLVALFVVVIIAIFVEEWRGQHGGAKRIHPKDAVIKINRESATVLDVRSADLFQKSHVRNAVHVAIADFELHAKKLEKLKATPVILCCSVGNMGTQAVQKLKKLGFTDLSVLAGGVEAWTRDGLPTVKGG